MKDRWEQLTTREKQTVIFGSMGASILLIYFLIWSPLSNAVQNQREQLQQNQTLLVWMQNTSKQIQILEKTTHSKKIINTHDSLLNIIQQQIKQSTFASNLDQLHQGENDSVQLTFKKVDFDRLIAWLTKQSEQQGWKIIQMAVTPTKTPGLAAVEIQLQNQ